MRGRGRAPEASGSVGTSRSARLYAIHSDPDAIMSRASAPRRTAGASRCRVGTWREGRFAIARGRWRTPGRTRDCAAAPRSAPTCFAPRRGAGGSAGARESWGIAPRLRQHRASTQHATPGAPSLGRALVVNGANGSSQMVTPTRSHKYSIPSIPRDEHHAVKEALLTRPVARTIGACSHCGKRLCEQRSRRSAPGSSTRCVSTLRRSPGWLAQAPPARWVVRATRDNRVATVQYNRRALRDAGLALQLFAAHLKRE